jgi:hypothetical protein
MVSLCQTCSVTEVSPIIENDLPAPVWPRADGGGGAGGGTGDGEGDRKGGEGGGGGGGAGGGKDGGNAGGAAAAKGARKGAGAARRHLAVREDRTVVA